MFTKLNRKNLAKFILLIIACFGIYTFANTSSIFATPGMVEHQLLADVNGDNRADAIIITTEHNAIGEHPQSHKWWVAISDGSQFGAPSLWASNFGNGPGGIQFFAADVTGDSMADAVTFDPSTGDWYVMPSNGTVFGNGDPNYAPIRWVEGHGAGSDNQFLADINNDGTSDAIIFINDTGEWWVGPSEGDKFGIVGHWFTGVNNAGHGVGSSKQFVADVTGDGRADAIVFFNNGEWWVAGNNHGASFGIPSRWQSGHGVGSNNQLLSDATGDSRADAIVFFAQTGRWYVAPSSGTAFNNGDPFYSPPLWMSGHGVGSNNQLVGDATGDGSSDSAVFFSGSQGDWYVAPSSGSSFNNGDPNYFPPLWISGHGAGT